MKNGDNMNRMILGYNRISTLKQSDGTSLKHQEQKIKEYKKKYGDYKVQ